MSATMNASMNTHSTADLSRLQHARWFWVATGAVVLVQLAAFWMLCNWQVRIAQEREAAVQVQRAAFVDCMRDSPQALNGGCVSRVAAAR